MPTQVELFEYQDVPSRESIQGLLDAGGRAGLKLGGLYVPKLLAQSAIPLVVPSSGSVAANGALTGLSGLAVALFACYMYMPAGAVYAGSPAGFYYAEMGSTTTATLYMDRYTGGAPLLPASPTPVSAAGPGAYTQTTGADITLGLITVPGGCPGPTGSLWADISTNTINNVNTKTFKIVLASTNMYTSTSFSTSQTGSRALWKLYNRGRQDRQVSTSVGAGIGAGTAVALGSVDTSQDYTISWSIQLSVATDWFVCDAFSFQVFQGD